MRYLLRNQVLDSYITHIKQMTQKINTNNSRALHFYTTSRMRTGTCRVASTDRTVTSEGFNIISMAWS